MHGKTLQLSHYEKLGNAIWHDTMEECACLAESSLWSPSWELPLPKLPGSCAPISQPLFGAPITLLHSGSSLLPLGAPRIYKFQNTPLLLSIQSLSLHEYTTRHTPLKVINR